MVEELEKKRKWLRKKKSNIFVLILSGVHLLLDAAKHHFCIWTDRRFFHT